MDINEASQLAKRAAEFFRDGWFEQSLELLEQVERAFPGDKKIRYNLAVCLGRVGRTDEAVEMAQELVGQFSAERLERLHAMIRQGAEAPMPSNFTSTFASESDGAGTPRPHFGIPAPVQQTAPPAPTPEQRRVRRVAFRHAAMGAWEPVSSVMLAGRQPALLTCGFVADQGEEEVAAPLPGQPLGAEPEAPRLSNSGWKAFVKLIEGLITESPQDMWTTGEAIQQSKTKSFLETFEGNFGGGELMVALGVFKSKVPLLMTDRHLCFVDPVKAQSVPWEAIESLVGVTDNAPRHLEVRLRDARRILIDLGGSVKALAEPLGIFLNEVSFLYELEGTPVVLMPPRVTAVEMTIPPLCCGCMSEDVANFTSFPVRDPADPLEVEDDEPEKGGIASVLFKKRQKEVRPTMGPIELRRCTFCDWHVPVRIATVGEGMRAFVFQNGNYAQRFYEENARSLSEEGGI